MYSGQLLTVQWWKRTGCAGKILGVGKLSSGPEDHSEEASSGPAGASSTPPPAPLPSPGPHLSLPSSFTGHCACCWEHRCRSQNCSPGDRGGQAGPAGVDDRVVVGHTGAGRGTACYAGVSFPGQFLSFVDYNAAAWSQVQLGARGKATGGYRWWAGEGEAGGWGRVSTLQLLQEGRLSWGFRSITEMLLLNPSTLDEGTVGL